MNDLESLVLETMGIKEDEFYQKPFCFSYSSLSKLMWNPTIFYEIYVMGIRPEKKEQYLINGKLIHAILLNTPDEFNSMYCLSNVDLPTDNVRKIIDKVFYRVLKDGVDPNQVTLADHPLYILEEMEKANYQQSLKTDQQRLAKIIMDSTESYWSFLAFKEGKELIDEKQYTECRLSAELISTNLDISKLMGMDNKDPNIEVYNEKKLEITSSTLKNFPFGLQGIIDNYVIDHNTKTIFINDLKTTSKSLKDFPDSIEIFDYWLQAAIYSMLIGMTYMDLILSGYSVKFHFVVIDNSQQVYPFLVSQETLNKWTDKMINTLEKARYHYSNKKYDLPYDFSIGKVIL